MKNSGQPTVEALQQGKAELASQNTALTHFKQVAASQEMRLLQLEQEVNHLCQQQGEAARYPHHLRSSDLVTQPPQAAPPGDSAEQLAQMVKTLRAQLHESEARYRLLFESLDEGYCVIEKVGDEAGELLDFRYVETNPAFAAQTGLHDVVGKTLRQVLPDEFEERIRTYDAVHKTGEATRFEREFVMHGRLLELYAFRVADKPRGRVAINLQDITARKKTEQLLRQNQDTFFNLVQNSPFGLYIVDAQFRLCQVSNASRKVFSQIDPLIGRDFDDVLRQVWAEPFVSEALGHFRHTLATGEAYAAPNTTAQRQNIPDIESYDWKIERITLPDGQFGVACYFYDITERMQAQAALQESEERLRLALAVGGMGVWVVDLTTPDGTATFDEQACALMRLEPGCREMTMSKILDNVIHPDDRTLIETAMSRIAEGVRDGGVVEYRMVRPDGTVTWLQGDGTVQLDATGASVRFIGVNFDITARKQAEETLRKSEAFSRSIIKSSPDCIKVLDLGGKLLSMENGQALLGIEDIRPFLNKSWLDFWESASEKRQAQAAVVAATAGKAASFVGFFRTLQGEPKWWDVAVTPIFGADGQPARLLAVSRDVTQRQQAEAELRASEERLGLALDAAELGTFNIDLASNTLTADARFRTIFGIMSGTVDYEQAFAAVHPEDRPGQRAAVAAATRTDNPVAYVTEYRVVHPDGAIRWIFARGRANFGVGNESAGKPLSFDGTVADITKRKQAESALRQSAAQFETLLNEAPLGVYLVDADFRIRQVNPTALPVFGTISGLIGRDFAEVMHILWPETQADELVKRFRHTLTTGEPCYAFELIEQRADRQTTEYYEWQISRIPLPDGGYGVVCYFRDISERMRAQQALLDSEARYRGLFNSIDEGFAIIELIFNGDDQADDYRFMEVNPAFQKQTGIANPTGKRIREIVLDQQVAGIETYRHVLLTGEPQRFVTESKAWGRYFDVYATRLDGPDSRKVAVVFNNITERREANQKLRDSEQRFRALVLASSDLMCRMSPDWSEMRQVFDRNTITQTTAPNSNWLEQFVHRDDQPELMATVREAIRTKSLFEMEHRVRRADGSWGWMLSRAVPLIGASGEIVEWFGTGSDVTEQKRAGQALRDSEVRYRSLFNSIDTGFCIIEMIFDAQQKPVDYRYLEVNPAFEQQSGLHDAAGKRLQELVLDFDKSWLEIYGQVALTGEAIRFVRQAKALDARWLDVYAFPHGERESRKVALLFNDITERKLLEQATLAQAQALTELDRRKDEFLAMLGHELRNPLAALSNAVHLMRLKKDEGPIQYQARSTIERQVGQLKNLVDDLLEISRISSGRVRLRQQPVSVGGIVERAVETAQPLIIKCRHQLDVSLPPQPVFLHADAARLEQVLVNLLTNAAKYTDTGGRIWLSVETDQATEVAGIATAMGVVICVRDTGIGIAPELLPRIFDLFTQADRSLDRSQGGLGIGLCLVQRLVELHGGTVEAHSVLGEGSEFIVRLPALLTALPVAPALPSLSLETAPASVAGCRVLVVDDNVDAAQSLGALLEMTGHAVTLAYDGPSALQSTIAQRPDLVLLDIGLPGLDGFEVAHRIRQQATLTGTVLVALTGYGQDTDRKRSQDAGFDFHLVKPVAFEEIEKILLSVTERVT